MSAGAATCNKRFEELGQILFGRCWNFSCGFVIRLPACISYYCSLNNAAFSLLLHRERDHQSYIMLTVVGETSLLNRRYKLHRTSVPGLFELIDLYKLKLFIRPNLLALQRNHVLHMCFDTC